MAAALLVKLESALPALDIVIINQQVQRGIHTAFLQGRLNTLLARHPGKTFVADSRHLAGAYANCLRRLNEVEATRLCGAAREYGDVLSSIWPETPDFGSGASRRGRP